MKILMLVPYLPTITMSGGQTRWYNIIKYLSKKHDITLFSLIKDDNEKKFIPELRKYCKKVKGKMYYFGSDKKEALQRYLDQAAYLHGHSEKEVFHSGDRRDNNP